MLLAGKAGFVRVFGRTYATAKARQYQRAFCTLYRGDFRTKESKGATTMPLLIIAVYNIVSTAKTINGA